MRYLTLRNTRFLIDEIRLDFAFVTRVFMALIISSFILNDWLLCTVLSLYVLSLGLLKLLFFTLRLTKLHRTWEYWLFVLDLIISTDSWIFRADVLFSAFLAITPLIYYVSLIDWVIKFLVTSQAEIKRSIALIQ